MADPQHPDIAALEQAKQICRWRVDFSNDIARERIIGEIAAAFTSPENEEVRRLIDHLENGPLDGSHLGQAASFLARLARERDWADEALLRTAEALGLQATRLMYLDAATIKDRATRAEQEAARLRAERDVMERALVSLRAGDHANCYAAQQIAEKALVEAERALAAATGTEEP